MLKTIVTSQFGDWKDTEGNFENIQTALLEMGIYMVNDPMVEGTDGYQFIFIKAIDGEDEIDLLEEALMDELKPEIMTMKGISDDDMEMDEVEDEINMITRELIDDIIDQVEGLKQ